MAPPHGAFDRSEPLKGVPEPRRRERPFAVELVRPLHVGGIDATGRGLVPFDLADALIDEALHTPATATTRTATRAHAPLGTRHPIPRQGYSVGGV